MGSYDVRYDVDDGTALNKSRTVFSCVWGFLDMLYPNMKNGRNHDHRGMISPVEMEQLCSFKEAAFIDQGCSISTAGLVFRFQRNKMFLPRARCSVLRPPEIESRVPCLESLDSSHNTQEILFDQNSLYVPMNAWMPECLNAWMNE